MSIRLRLIFSLLTIAIVPMAFTSLLLFTNLKGVIVKNFINESPSLVTNEVLLSEINSIGQLSLIICFVSLFLILIIAVSMAQTISRPLKLLEFGVKFVGKGNLDYKLNVESDDEVGRVSLAFNQMAENLKKVTASKNELNKEIDRRSKVEFLLLKRTKELEQLSTTLTEEKKMREAQRNALNNTALVSETDLEGKIVYVNDPFVKISKYTEKELLGQDHRIINSGYHPHSFFENLWSTISQGKVWKGEIRNRAKDGALYWVDTAIGPILDDEHKVMGYISIRFIITDRKQLEKSLKESNQELDQQAQRLKISNEELEQFAYVASHDLQEPLRMVNSYVKLLEEEYKGKLDKEADKYIHYAIDGAERMMLLINDLLAFSRVGSQRKEVKKTDCSLILEELFQDLKLVIQENKASITHDPLPTIMSDELQVRQLFQNLIGNAIKFKGDKRPEIHVGVERENNEWKFSVRDNGIGIDLKQSDRIFVIFQRLHSRDKYPGTGIGLAISKKIVERHNGRIWIESKLGQGTTFFFTIPIIKGDKYE